MTHRERMLSTIEGQPTDRIPWAPRMDLWCIAQRARGTIPDRFAGKTTPEMADELGAACHAVRADYTRPRDQGDLILRGLGIDNHPDYPFRIELRDLACESTSDRENIRTRIETPAGPVTFHLQQDSEMTQNGISLPFVKDYPITSVADFDAVASVFEHLEVIPTPDTYADFQGRVGDRGLAIASGPVAASPIHLVLHELTPMDQFFYLHADEPDALRVFEERLTPFFEDMLDALMICDAEVIFWGGNYDQDLTWPPFFASQIAPWLQKVSERAHRGGKLLLTHTDGENQNLLSLYPTCRFDVAESVCPAPMTHCDLAELRAGFGSHTTVWGGIPSVALLPDTFDDREFDSYLDDLFDALGTGERLILGVSDNVPPDADLSRLDSIADRIDSFGAVTPSGCAAREVGT